MLIGACLFTSVAHASITCVVDESTYRWDMLKVGNTFTLSLDGFKQINSNFVNKSMFNGETNEGIMSINSETGRFTFYNSADMNFIRNNAVDHNTAAYAEEHPHAEGRCRPQ